MMMMMMMIIIMAIIMIIEVIPYGGHGASKPRKLKGGGGGVKTPELCTHPGLQLKTTQGTFYTSKLTCFVYIPAQTSTSVQDDTSSTSGTMNKPPSTCEEDKGSTMGILKKAGLQNPEVPKLHTSYMSQSHTIIDCLKNLHMYYRIYFHSIMCLP